MSDKATHTFNGVKVKVFTKDGKLTRIAEIMEGEDAGKWTTVDLEKIKAL